MHVCPECGSGRTAPHVAAKGLGALYPAGYNAYSLPGSPAMRLLATALFKARYARGLRRAPLAALEPPANLLDVGSGRGDLGVALGPRGFAVTGLEPSPEAVGEARSRATTACVGTLTDPPADLPGAPFDAAVFNHSLEHVVEPAEDLRRVRDLLRPGGLALISVPNFGSWQARRYGADWFHLDLPRHRAHLTPAGLRALLERTGFAVSEVTTTTSPDGLPTSIQYRRFGHRAFDSGIGLAAVAGLSLLASPLVASLDRLRGGGDFLHAVAERT